MSDVPEQELRPILGETAAKVYSFDLNLLQPIADRVGPSVDEVATPLETPPTVPDESVSPVFATTMPVGPYA
jgi:hypothetical protein